MKHVWSIASLLLLWLVSLRARADELGLAVVLASAERHHPLVRAALADHDAADGELRGARGGFDPSWITRAQGQPVGGYQQWQVDTTVTQPTPLWGASAFVGYRFGDDMPSYYGDRLTKQAGEIRGGVSVPLWRNGPTDRRRTNIEKAGLGVEIASLSVEQQRLLIARDASFRYWDWVAAAKRRAIAEDLLRIAVDRDAGIAARAASGDVPTIDRTDNQRAIAQRQGFVVSADRALAQNAIELSLFWRGADGAPQLPDAARAPSLPEPAAPAIAEPSALGDAERKRPELRRFDAQRRQQDVEIAWAKNQRAPAVDLWVTTSVDLGDPRASRPDLDKPVLAGGVMIDLPIFNRTADGRVKAAEAARTKVDEQRRFALDRVRAEVRDAANAVETASRRLAVARLEVTLAVELERAERTRFDAGDGSLLLVNLREQATAEARLREVDALADGHKAAAALRWATGAR